jgi:hypothetical protein
MEEQEAVIIDPKLREDLLDYLQDKPYNQVVKMIKALVYAPTTKVTYGTDPEGSGSPEPIPD